MASTVHHPQNAVEQAAAAYARVKAAYGHALEVHDRAQAAIDYGQALAAYVQARGDLDLALENYYQTIRLS